MSRAERLLALMQILRRYRYPVRGQILAHELGISLRTLYRDIRSLQSQGADIEGEAGVGYQLKPGFTLPPLMFSADEIDALVFGSRWVSQKGDEELSRAAQNVLAKIAAIIPNDLQYQLNSSCLLVGPSQIVKPAVEEQLISSRKAIRHQYKMAITYRDLKDVVSERTVWPFALGFFDKVDVLLAWCELRQEIRCFRLDRLMSLDILTDKYPRSRQSLLKEWQRQQNVTL
jgi:predicted DNA-binding transcriptional regulator YafY